MIARPVCAPPAWTIRRAEWPPSRPERRASAVAGRRRSARRAPRSSRDRRRRLASQHLDRAGAAQAAPGVERVLGVARGRVVAAPAPPRARPGPRSSSSPASGFRETSATSAPGLGGPERDVQAGGAAADHRHVGARRARLRLRRPRRGTVSRWGSTSPTPPRSSTTPGPIPRTPGACGRSRRRSRRPAGRASSGPRRPPRPASSSSGSTRERHIDAIEALCAARRRHDRRRHAREPGLVRGRPPRGRRRRRGRRAPAGRRARPSPSAACARPATTPSPTGRWASACSTTSRSRRAHALAALRRRAGPGPRLGRPPRQRDRGDLRRLGPGALREHPPVAALPGHRAGRVRGRGAGEGFTVNLPVAARGRVRGVPRAGPARGRARSRAPTSPGCSRSRPATTPTATIRSPTAWSTTEAYGDDGRDDARARRRARRAGPRLPRGRLRPGGARRLGRSRRSRRSTASASPADAPAEPARAHLDRQRRHWPEI